MKRLLICAAALAAAGCVSLRLAECYRAGVWRGVGQGYYGPVSVAVETDTSSILNIEILEEHEDPFIGGEALRELLEIVLEEDSTNVDGISGATYSSNALLNAIDDALRLAADRASAQ